MKAIRTVRASNNRNVPARWAAAFFSLVATVLIPMHAAQATNFINEIDYNLEQPLGGTTTVANFTEYLQVVYSFALGIVGIIAVTLIMFGGMRWISAAGNEQVIGQAKEVIVSAVTGLVIAMLSYTILQFINPNFTTIKALNIQEISVAPNADVLIDLDACDSGVFREETCLADNGTEMDCSAVACSGAGTITEGNNKGKTCRGVVCDEGGCYRSPTDFTSYSCQQADCGQWTQDCADGNSDSAEFGECLCNYYEEKAAPLFGIERSDSAVSGEQIWTSEISDEERVKVLYMCEERWTQEQTASVAGNDGSGYTGVNAAAEGWNCGYQACTLEERTSVTLFNYLDCTNE